MKKLMLLSAVAMLMAGTTGCRCFDWLWRGSRYPAMPAATYVDPCNPCDPCAMPAADACGPITPGPETYAPAPVR